MDKKIYLIDDNKDGNREQYGGYFDNSIFSDVFCEISKISLSDDLSFIDNAACILIHNTLNDYYDGGFHEDSQKVVAKVRGWSGMGDTIPVVYFSDGFTSDRGEYNPDTPNVIYCISKRAFYSRLESFVANYKQTGHIELRLLAFGKNYEKEVVERAVTEVYKRLQEYTDTDTLDVTLIACPEMEQIVELSQPALGVDYVGLINSLQITPITIEEFKDKINFILESFIDYGKNYYSWS